ncbi:MAG: ABC transporter permease subunit [Planctomycetota bacterium]|jgi:ABC-type transport system involved in multi-copper enzyme maturation permease subunit
MIRQIVYKEVLENLLSLRFALSVLLTTSLFVVCGYVFVNGYNSELEDYWNKTNDNLSVLREESSQLYKVAFYKQGIYRKPRPLGLCAEGFEQSLPNFFEVNAFTAELPKTEGQVNFALPHFSHVDWALIISLIMSFAALVLTYDSICGEKQAGTLRIMLANTIPRHKVLLGKYLGAIFTLAVPLIVGLLVSLIIVVASKNIAINGGDWLKILILVIVSLLYLSIFVLLGMFVSSRTSHPANSMAILLLVWVVSVILLPSFCRIIFDISYEEPTQAELEKHIEQARDEIWDNRERYGKNAGNWSSNINDPSLNPPARARLRNALTDAVNQIRQDHHNKLLAQAFARRNVASISPAVVYQRASEAIAGTGMNRCVNLYEQVKQYGRQLKEFIRSKDSEDPESLHLINPGRETVHGGWRAISHKPVDFGAIPRFQERDLALGQSLKLAIWDIGLLALFNLVFFAAAFVSFLKYDVR